MERKEFLRYYHEEVSYLRVRGEQFARKYPKEAAALHVSKNASQDPHVERLIESFAFLSAQLRQRIDDNLFQMGESMMGVLHPYYLQPNPPFSIAHFKPNKEYATFVKKNTELTGPNKIKFKTITDAYIYPMSIIKVATQEEFLKITFSYPRVFEMKKLLIHLQPYNIERSNMIFEDLIEGDVFYSFDDDPKKTLLNSDFEFFGYDYDESVTPTARDSYAYHLLRDFFIYPEKFLFFSVNLGQMPRPPKNGFTLWFPFKKRVTPQIEDFHIHAVPIVNLFETLTDPIELDETKSEYLLVVDAQKPEEYETHSVLKIYTNEYEIKTFNEANTDHDIYYSLHRQPSLGKDVPGSELFIKFHFPKDFKPKGKMVVYGKVLATNRHRVNVITEQDKFQSSISVPQVQMMFRPKYLPYNFATDVWKLISRLSISHLYFSDPKRSLGLLKETLRLNGAEEYMLDLIQNISYKPLTTRLMRDGMHGFIRGVEITLEAKIQDNIAMLAAVLYHFFSSQVEINHFVSLRLVDFATKQEVKSWAPQIGKQKIL